MRDRAACCAARGRARRRNRSRPTAPSRTAAPPDRARTTAIRWRRPAASPRCRPASSARRASRRGRRAPPANTTSNEQLANQPSPARADRQPDRHLARPRRGTREQQVGDVRARDEQHDAGDREEQRERRLRFGVHVALAARSVFQGQQLRLELRERRLAHPFLLGSFDAVDDRVILPVERRACLIDGHARLQPAEQIRPIAPAIVEALEERESSGRACVIGTNTFGSDPSVVPRNPSGATPTIVIDWPLIVIFSPTTSGRPANPVCQYAWLKTTTCGSPGGRSSDGSSNRPAAGRRPSTGK